MAALKLSADLIGVRTGAPTIASPMAAIGTHRRLDRGGNLTSLRFESCQRAVGVKGRKETNATISTAQQLGHCVGASSNPLDAKRDGS